MSKESVVDVMLLQSAIEEGERGGERMFTLKKWNAVAMWSWDVECDTCAICRVQVNLMPSFKTIVKLCPPGDGRVSEVPI